MNDDLAIEVIVPEPWRKIGRVFCSIGILSLLGYFWMVFIYPEPLESEKLVVAWIVFFCGPPFCCFCMPVFLDRYPAWFVRLVGQKRLHKFIADCKMYSAADRAEKAKLSDPGSWVRDQKTFWLVIIVGCAVLGVVNALN